MEFYAEYAPSKNGGWFVGAPFAAHAAYAPVPVVPDAGFLTSTALVSANPPPGATMHFPGGGLRPGNNTPVMAGVHDYGSCHDVLCAADPAKTHARPTCPEGDLVKYWSWSAKFG